MKRTIYAHELNFRKSRGKTNKEPQNYEQDFYNVLSEVQKMDEKSRSKDIKKERLVLFLSELKYIPNKHIFKLVFQSARYGMVRDVINTVTFKNRGPLKGKPDGDLEKTHVVIKFEDNKTAVALYEYNSDGISFRKVIEYLEEKIEEYHNGLGSGILYRIDNSNIVSRDFLDSLERLKRIKAVTLTVDQNDVGVSETKSFAGRNDLSDDIDIVLKPAKRGMGIRGNTVKEFYELYNNKKMPIKRITVKGDRETKDPLTFDTEKMKEKYPIEVNELINGEVDSEDLFNEMVFLCKYF